MDKYIFHLKGIHRDVPTVSHTLLFDFDDMPFEDCDGDCDNCTDKCDFDED